MPHRHVGDMEAFQAGGAGAATPFAHFLTEQGARFPAEAGNEPTCALGRVTSHRHVDTEGNARAELDRTVAIVDEGSRCPELSVRRRQPVRWRSAP